jgi:glycosyltransferase involved in cell wall biosynthesis
MIIRTQMTNNCGGKPIKGRLKTQSPGTLRVESFGAGMSPLKVLVASHSHPKVSNGGAEIAAFQLYNALLARPEYEPWFLGCARDQVNRRLGATISQPYSEREYIYSAGEFDWFKFSNRDPSFPREFRELLLQLKPDVVHFHHYINFGVEAFLHVRETLPDCKIVVTLHEYLALCHHFGQMVTKTHRALCHESAPSRCSSCFKDIPPSDFFLRRMYIQRFFALADHFISPSEFLARRYIDWGILEDRVTVIENVIRPSAQAGVPTRTLEDGGLLRVGYFGQVSFLKGVNTLFEAAEFVEKREMDNIVFEVYGDYSGQPTEFQDEFVARLAKTGRNVRFHGPYDHARVDRLMQAVDVVVVPSNWWENSPVVIQEALRNRRPVICSDIGGMAEKVRDGIDGFHFPVGNSVALALLLLRIAKAPKLLADLIPNLRQPAEVEEIGRRHAQLYSSLA